jgi:hypothetical protein
MGRSKRFRRCHCQRTRKLGFMFLTPWNGFRAGVPYVTEIITWTSVFQNGWRSVQRAPSRFKPPQDPGSLLFRFLLGPERVTKFDPIIVIRGPVGLCGTWSLWRTDMVSPMMLEIRLPVLLKKI